MNNKFDELAKGLAQSLTRREAFKKFGLGMIGALTASLGLAKASAQRKGRCVALPTYRAGGNKTYGYINGGCLDLDTCQYGLSSDCPYGQYAPIATGACGQFLSNKSCSF